MTRRVAVVTGCAGFIGSHLSERLLADGWRVRGIDAFTPYYDPLAKRANLTQVADDPDFCLLELDLADADLATALAGADVVFHLAAQPGVRGSFGDGFADYVRDNVLATQRLLEAARYVGSRRVVWASSSSVYGDAESFPCIEDRTPTSPRSPYGATKRSCEDLARIYAGLGLESVGLRYFTVYGPRQRPDMAMRRLCEAAHGGPPFCLFGSGSQSRDFTYVDDAVDATVRAASAPSPPPLVNVGGGEEATLAAVVDLVGELAGEPLPVRREQVHAGDVTRTAADTTRARRALGWAPTTGLREGLANELAWVERRHVATGASRSERPTSSRSAAPTARPAYDRRRRCAGTRS